MPDGREDDLFSAVDKSFGLNEQQEDNTQQEDTQQQEEGQQQLDMWPPQQQEQPQEQVEQTAAEAKAEKEKQQLFEDKPKRGPNGELLDRNGNVVAVTRRERQLAYNLNRAQYAANRAAKENKELRAHMQQLAGVDHVLKQHNIQPQVAAESLAMRAKADGSVEGAIEVIREIVARTLANGVTMEQLFGNDVMPAINAKVIHSALDERLGPLQRDVAQKQREAENERAAQESTQQFIATHEFADIHGVEIARLVQQHGDKGMSPSKAYYELRLWAQEHNLDFSQPLKPQIEAAMRHLEAQRQQPQQAAQQRRPQSTPGQFRAAAPSSGNGTVDRHQPARDFSATDPWNRIAAEVMRSMKQ